MNETVRFIDLQAQYQQSKALVNQRIQRVLEHGQYIMGPEVLELEKRLEEFTASRHCVTVSSGTEALLIALMALGVSPGDEVITTPFTFVATAEVIAMLGATPVFVDVEADSCNINPDLIEAAIGPRTRAIIPVSLYGQPADMDEINAVADRHGITVIEDAAQSFGAKYKGRRSCNLSKIGCTSFFPSKPLGCYGDGGAIFTDDEVLAQAMREIRVHGQERRYYHTRVGVGGRMDTIQCAIVLAKLETLEWEIEQRLAIGDRYIEKLSQCDEIRVLKVHSDRTCVWGQFTVQSDTRAEILERLKTKGIPTAIHYPIPLHKQPAYSGISRICGTLENAEAISQRVFSLPMHPFLSEAEQNLVVAAMLKA